jgi:hypothetical protein
VTHSRESEAVERIVRHIAGMTFPESGHPYGSIPRQLVYDARAALLANPGQRITHGRHCTCSACGREDWTNPDLAPCGMHGAGCPALYDPWGPPGSYR